jgi:hypothetical protein
VNALRLFGVAASDGDPHSLASGTEVVTFRDLAAIVAETPHARPALADGDVATHRSVVESVFAHRAILPAPAGVVFRARDALERWLELHFVTLTDALAYVEGRVGARVHVTRKSDRPSGAYAAVAGAGAGRPMAPPAPTEEMVIDVGAIAAESFRVLRRHAAASITVRPATPDSGEAIASFLLERDRWSAFEAAVQEEARRDFELAFRLTGPWPPYDFVRMQFGR